jgi:hypothetical protein
VDQWTFLTNHAQVLLCLAGDPEARLRDIADCVGITARATQRIVSDLVAEGYVTRTKTGRRNKYGVHPELPLRHGIEQRGEVGAFLGLLNGTGEER